MTTDLTLIVTAHDETSVCGPTMRSADLAVAAARAAGLTVQTVVGLDRATAATTSYFWQPRFDDWERWESDEGDPGGLRNVMVPRTDGRLIAFLDADGLFSENWLVEAAALLDAEAERGRRSIAHPELDLVFDGLRSVGVNLPDDSPLFTPYYLYARHSYDSLFMAPREAYLEIQYRPPDGRGGRSCQDIEFTVESLDAGWHHVVVRDTVIFRRRRTLSASTESNARRSTVRSLPAMAIDRVRSLGSATR